MSKRKHIYLRFVAATLAVAGCAALAYGIWLRPKPPPQRHPQPQASGDDIVKIAYSFKNGGGYDAKRSGVTTDVMFGGTKILTANETTHCSGFTFVIAMRASRQRSLLKNINAIAVKRFQKEWYGAVPGSEVKTLVTAMEHLGIGREIYALDAQPGDFVQFWAHKSGHSAIFLEWLKRDGKVVGLKYRSSQPATKGIGDHSGHFTTSGLSTGVIEPEKFFVGRLN